MSKVASESPHFGRRDLLKLLGLVGLAAAIPIGISLSKGFTFVRNPFGLGVASGDPSSDGVVLWTRLVGSELPANRDLAVNWRIMLADEPETVVKQGEAAAIAALAHSVHVEVSGLKPDTWYFYEFSIAGHRSVIGRTRTLPDATWQASTLTLAYASCQRYEDGYFSAYRAMKADNPDLVCFVGDYIYEYATRRDSIRPHTLPRITDLAGYRLRYALYKSDENLQAMHAHCPWLVVWDDHEVENNYAAAISTEGRGDISTLRAAAYQAFYEHMPIRAAAMVSGIEGVLAGQELRLYQQVEFGKLANLLLIDNRQYRSEPLCGVNPAPGIAAVCEENDQQARSMLGVAQEQWLHQALYASTHRWQLLLQQTRFAPSNYHRGYGVAFSRDTWDGYPETRQRILDVLAGRAEHNTLILGGDIHQHWVAKVHADAYDVKSPVVAAEFCGTSITSRSNTTVQNNETLASRNPHMLYANAQYRGYGLLKLNSEQAQVILKGVSDIADATSDTIVIAEFVVPNAQPQRIFQTV